MPQASEELRNEMERLFGDPIDDAGPMKFLRDAGYKLNPHFFWIPPKHVETYADMSHDEWLCLKFLCDEWDFGGFAGG